MSFGWTADCGFVDFFRDHKNPIGPACPSCALRASLCLTTESFDWTSTTWRLTHVHPSSGRPESYPWSSVQTISRAHSRGALRFPLADPTEGTHQNNLPVQGNGQRRMEDPSAFRGAPPLRFVFRSARPRKVFEGFLDGQQERKVYDRGKEEALGVVVAVRRRLLRVGAQNPLWGARGPAAEEEQEEEEELEVSRVTEVRPGAPIRFPAPKRLQSAEGPTVDPTVTRWQAPLRSGRPRSGLWDPGGFTRSCGGVRGWEEAPAALASGIRGWTTMNRRRGDACRHRSVRLRFRTLFVAQGKGPPATGAGSGDPRLTRVARWRVICGSGSGSPLREPEIQGLCRLFGAQAPPRLGGHASEVTGGRGSGWPVNHL